MIQAGDVGRHLDGAALGLPHRGWPSRWSEFGWGECDCHAPDGPRGGRSGRLPKLAAAVGGFVGLSENPACDIGEATVQASGAQVDPERVAAFGLNSYNTRCVDIAAGSSTERTRPCCSNASMISDMVLFGQTGHLGKVRSRDGTVVQKRFETLRRDNWRSRW